MKFRIAALKGDGIGPETMEEALKGVRTIADKYGHEFEFIYAPFGAQAYFDHGHPFPEQTKRICDEADAIAKGPIGLAVKEMKKIPDEFSPETSGLLPMRKRYNTSRNGRPVVLKKEFADFSPLKPEVVKDGFDILMIRELVGGIYFGKKIEGKETDMQYAYDECKYTREQVEDIAHFAFKEARARNSKLTNVHKKNVLATARFWNSVVEDVAKEYPEVPLESMLVDAVAYKLVVDPTQFNGVMLFENMQGDIITDLGGGILGSLGLMPSFCEGPKKSIYEPAHGSAPDIAGKNIANPYSMIGSMAFMLERSFGLKEEAKDLWGSLTNVFGQGYRTGELANKNTPKDKIISTSQFGDKVKEYILSNKA